MPATRQSAAKQNIAASEKRSVSCARSAAGVRGRPRNVTPKALTKQAAASAADSASSAPTAGTRNFRPHGRQLRAQQDRLEGQPLGDEAVERRQCGDRDAADQKREGGLRHAMDEAAEMLHVALAGRGQHRAGAEEQQALEDACD